MVVLEPRRPENRDVALPSEEGSVPLLRREEIGPLPIKVGSDPLLRSEEEIDPLPKEEPVPLLKEPLGPGLPSPSGSQSPMEAPSEGPLVTSLDTVELLLLFSQ